jgi:hypothetical protein
MMTQDFDKILDFSKGNVLVYNFICKNIIENSNGGGIMPFIGDGLAKFTFGDSISFIEDVLKWVNNTLSDTQRQNVQEKEEKNGFIEALDELINILGGQYGEDVINRHLEEFYSDEKIDPYALENQAVSLVPLLNYGDSVTTNFDHVLEYAYELAGINPSIATPYDCNVLNNKIRSNSEAANKALLFKVHGDIISNATERIITKSAFDENYKNNPIFMENLTKWIQKYKLLFIGVDLLKNNYLREVLKENKSEGSHHYAIVGCKDDDGLKDKMKDELAELNIMPIIYDIDKPISVEIILHKILVDTKNERILKNSNRGEYHYKYSEHDLIGREIEIKKLEEFLNSKSKYTFDFSWWMIWGKDVAGKSKLAYEFARKHASTWDWYMIAPGQIDSFINKQISINKNNRKLFVIFDDYDCYNGGISIIFNFIKRVKRYCKKIRVLLIVRDYKTSEICKIATDKERKDEVRVMLLRSAFSGPREICQLSINDIKEICYQYIWYRKRNLGLADLQEEELLSIDDELGKFIKNQMNEDKSLLLLCSLEKAINLILKNIFGSDEDASDGDIINKVMRYILTDGEGNLNNPNVNILEIDRRKDYRKKQAKKLMEKYDKQKEYNKDYYSSEYETDSFIFEIEKE